MKIHEIQKMNDTKTIYNKPSITVELLLQGNIFFTIDVKLILDETDFSSTDPCRRKSVYVRNGYVVDKIEIIPILQDIVLKWSYAATQLNSNFIISESASRLLNSQEAVAR
jgi:hypothetical protein